MKRSDWPTGLVEEAILSEDAKVRKIRVMVFRRGRQVEYLRPVAEVVLLYSPKMNSDYFSQAGSMLSRFFVNPYSNPDGFVYYVRDSATQHGHGMCE